MCGKCCEAIHINKSPEEIRNLAERNMRDGWSDANDDTVFIHFHWEPISYEQAMEINPYFRSNIENMVRRGIEGAEDFYRNLYFYTCKHYDKEHRLCTIHEIRPQICSGYPWYGEPPSEGFLFYSADCGYRIDVPKEGETS